MAFMMGMAATKAFTVGGVFGAGLKKAAGVFGKGIKKAIKPISKKMGVSFIGALKKGLSFITTIPFLPQFTDFARSIMDLGTSPALQLLSEILGGLGAIIGVIIEPLRPFIDLLNIFAMALSAALVPLTAEIYEMLIPAFDEIIAGIPEMTRVITDFITENPTIFTDLMALMQSSIVDLIPKIVELIPTFIGLTVRFFELTPTLLELIPVLLQLAAKFLDISFSLIESGLLNSLLIIADRFVDLMIVMSPLIPIIVWITDAIGGLLSFLRPWAEFTGFFQAAGRAGGISGLDVHGRTAGGARGRQYGGMIPSTGWYHMEAGENVETAESGAGMGAVEIHIHGNVFGINDLEDKIFGELERRKRLGLI